MDPIAGGLSPVLGVLSDSIRAIDDGRCVHKTMCLGVARVLRASVAAFVRMDVLSQQCAVKCWVEALDWSPAPYTTCETWSLLTSRASANASGQWRHSAAFVVIRNFTGSSDFVEVRLAAGDDETRLAVFGRGERFRPQEVDLVAACEDSFAALDAHVWRREAAGVCSAADESPPLARKNHDVDGWRHGQVAGLTKREVEVLTLLSQGLKVRSMASRLGVSPRTVNKHLANVYQKLGAHDRMVAVHNAQSLGVLPRL